MMLEFPLKGICCQLWC